MENKSIRKFGINGTLFAELKTLKSVNIEFKAVMPTLIFCIGSGVFDAQSEV